MTLPRVGPIPGAPLDRQYVAASYIRVRCAAYPQLRRRFDCWQARGASAQPNGSNVLTKLSHTHDFYSSALLLRQSTVTVDPIIWLG